MTNAIGIIMFAALLLGLVGFSVRQVGGRATVAIFGVVAGLCAWIALAAYLVTR